MSAFDIDDPGTTLALIGLLYILGRHVTRNTPHWQTIGKRMGFAALLLSCAVALWSRRDFASEVLFETLMRGLLFAALVTALVWILLPALTAIHRYAIVGPIGQGRTFTANLQSRWHNAQRRRQQADVERDRQANFERLAPARAEAERQRAVESEQQRQAQRTREDARIRCEVLYRLHEPELRMRFPAQLFEDFVTRHMHDGRSAEEVKARAGQLQQLIEAHLARVDTRQFQNINQLAHWFLAERASIEALPLDDDFKAEHLADLNERYSELTRQVLQKLSP